MNLYASNSNSDQILSRLQTSGDLLSVEIRKNFKHPGIVKISQSSQTISFMSSYIEDIIMTNFEDKRNVQAIKILIIIFCKHAWRKLVDLFNNRATVKFSDSLKTSDSEKLRSWILLEIGLKSIANTFSILLSSEMRNSYSGESIFKTKSKEILTFLEKVCSMDFVMEGDLLDNYQNLNEISQNRKKSSLNNSEDEIDPILAWKMRSKLINSASNEVNNILNESEDNFNENKKIINSYNKNGLRISKVDEFLIKYGDMIKNIRFLNESSRLSEINIEILSLKKDLQEKLNDLTLKKEFKSDLRDFYKEELNKLESIEANMRKEEKFETGEESSNLNLKNDKFENTCNENRKSETLSDRGSEINIMSFINKKSFVGSREKENQKAQLINNTPGNNIKYDETFQIKSLKKMKNSKALYENEFKDAELYLSFKKRPAIMLTVI